MIITNENGEQVEVFSQEELDATVDKVKEETLEAANQAREEEISLLTSQLEEKDNEINNIKSNGEDKSINLSNQRKIIEEKEKEKADIKQQLEETKNISNQAFTLIKEKNLEDKIKSFSSDQEVVKKMKHFYSQFVGEPKDDKETSERLNNAFLLATGGNARPINSAAMSSAGGYIPNPVISSEKMNAEQADLAHKLGLTDEELKKYNKI